MKLHKNSLKVQIWLYLAIFSISILVFLWIFQVLFLDTYYRIYKSKQIKEALNDVIINYDDNSLEKIARESGVCIELLENNTITYTTNMFNKGCMGGRGYENSSYKKDFIISKETFKKYELINPNYDNNTLIYAYKIKTNTYVFVSASLQPLDATITILSSQLLYITLLVLILSFLIAYFISKKISKPIIEINKKASNLVLRNYDIDFDTKDSILEIKELADTLNQTKDELAKTENLRRELLANISHDLKTPLTMIKAYAEMVRDINYNNKAKRNKDLNVIIDEVDRLNLLVNDIGELSKIQSNTLTLNYEDINLYKLIENIINKFDILIKDGYKFEIICDKKINIRADKMRIEQVLYNLINNAINYTGEDKIVKINVLDNKNDVRIEIIDTGKGISSEDLPYIWDKYYKADKTHSRETKGSGIGLSIVKNILIGHNFKYGVDTGDKGTTFYFVAKKSS